MAAYYRAINATSVGEFDTLCEEMYDICHTEHDSNDTITQSEKPSSRIQRYFEAQWQPFEEMFVRAWTDQFVSKHHLYFVR